MVDRDNLYDVEFSDQSLLDIVEVLMRKYVGIFSFPVPIDEDFVATKCSISIVQLRQALYRLSIEHVIKYIPCDRADVLFLKTEHLAQGNVKLSPLRYKMLQETYHKRMETMIEYVTEEDVCRSRFLLAYFGQSESADCGKCDVCRRNISKVQVNAGVTSDALVDFINVECHGEYSLKQINERFSNPMASYSPDYLDILRDLIDNRVVPPYKF